MTVFRLLFDLEPLHLAIVVFGVAVALFLSILYIVRNAKEGRLS